MLFINNNNEGSYLFVGLAALFLYGLNASPQVVLLSRLGNHNVVSFFLYLLLLLVVYSGVGCSDGL